MELTRCERRGSKVRIWKKRILHQIQSEVNPPGETGNEKTTIVKPKISTRYDDTYMMMKRDFNLMVRGLVVESPSLKWNIKEHKGLCRYVLVFYNYCF